MKLWIHGMLRVTTCYISAWDWGFFFLLFRYILMPDPTNTLQEVRMKRLVSSEDSSHLIMIRGVDVLVNAVSSELHLGKTWNKSSWIICCPQTLPAAGAPRCSLKTRAGCIKTVSQMAAINPN